MTWETAADRLLAESLERTSGWAGSRARRRRVRCLVFDDGETRVGIAIVDNLAIPRYVLDPVKQMVHERTGMKPERTRTTYGLAAPR